MATVDALIVRPTVPIVCELFTTILSDNTDFDFNEPFAIVSPLTDNSYVLKYMSTTPLPPAPPPVAEPEPPPPPPPPEFV